MAISRLFGCSVGLPVQKSPLDMTQFPPWMQVYGNGPPGKMLSQIAWKSSSTRCPFWCPLYMQSGYDVRFNTYQAPLINPVIIFFRQLKTYLHVLVNIMIDQSSCSSWNFWMRWTKYASLTFSGVRMNLWSSSSTVRTLWERAIPHKNNIRPLS